MKKLMLLAFAGLMMFVLLAPLGGLELQTPAQQVFWGMTVLLLGVITTVLAASMDSKPSPKATIDKFSKPPKKRSFAEREQELLDDFRLEMTRRRLGLPK